MYGQTSGIGGTRPYGPKNTVNIQIGMGNHHIGVKYLRMGSKSTVNNQITILDHVVCLK
jgi:hypothetical protein